MTNRIVMYPLNKQVMEQGIFDLNLPKGCQVLGLGTEAPEAYPCIYVLALDEEKENELRRFVIMTWNQAVDVNSLAYIGQIGCHGRRWFVFEVFVNDCYSRIDDNIMNQLKELDDKDK